MAGDDGATPPGGGNPAGGSILTKKTGPLANWIWMALLLLVALAYSLWKRNQSASTDEGPAPDGSDDTLDNQTPPPVFILPQNPQPTVPININLPATPPTAPPVAVKPPPTTTPPGAKPPPTAGAHEAVTVVKYTTKNPPWNSTVWGIAKHYGYGQAKNNWTTIWNDPLNASIRSKRGAPNKIQPGDRIYVRKR